MDNKGSLANEFGTTEILTMRDVLKGFWLLPNNQQRLKFLLNENECPDAVLKAMLEDQQFVAFLFRNLQFVKEIETRLGRIDGLAQMDYAKILPVNENIMAMRRKLMDCCEGEVEGKVVEEVQLSIGSQVLNLILEVYFCADGFSMHVLDEDVVTEVEIPYIKVDDANMVAAIIGTGDPEIPGQFGLYLINRGRREQANQYLKRAVELGARNYQLAYAANLFGLAIENKSYFDSCLQAWGNINFFDEKHCDNLIRLLVSNIELAFLCLEKLQPYSLRKLLVKLGGIGSKSDDIRQKLVAKIQDLLLIYGCRQLNQSDLPN